VRAVDAVHGANTTPYGASGLTAVRQPMRELVRSRLHNQRLGPPGLPSPAEVVGWLGAVQAQDYAGARWALGMRAPGHDDLAIERAYDTGAILRTHVMRPTWHFVRPEDIRWMLTLTAARVHVMNAFSYRVLELDEDIFRRSRRVFERALRDRQSLTRSDLQARLQQAGVVAAGLRLAYIMMHAELEQVICSGPRRGAQLTYALLAERAPQAKALAPENALAELVRRYFTSHGPATLRDFVWWSGLTVRAASTGLEMLGTELHRKTTDGRTYRYIAGSANGASLPVVHLLPNYDEYLIAYKDRDIPKAAGTSRRLVDDVHPYHVIVNGRLAGSWRREVKRSEATIEVATYRPLGPRARQALKTAADDYGRFVGLPMTLTQR